MRVGLELLKGGGRLWLRWSERLRHVTEARSGAGTNEPAIPLVTVTASRHTDNMREIVHIQAGQCGNQIGAKVSFPYFYVCIHTFILGTVKIIVRIL